MIVLRQTQSSIVPNVHILNILNFLVLFEKYKITNKITFYVDLDEQTSNIFFPFSPFIVGRKPLAPTLPGWLGCTSWSCTAGRISGEWLNQNQSSPYNFNYLWTNAVYLCINIFKFWPQLLNYSINISYLEKRWI